MTTCFALLVLAVFLRTLYQAESAMRHGAEAGYMTILGLLGSIGGGALTGLGTAATGLGMGGIGGALGGAGGALGSLGAAGPAVSTAAIPAADAVGATGIEGASMAGPVAGSGAAPAMGGPTALDSTVARLNSLFASAGDQQNPYAKAAGNLQGLAQQQSGPTGHPLSEMAPMSLPGAPPQAPGALGDDTLAFLRAFNLQG